MDGDLQETHARVARNQFTPGGMGVVWVGRCGVGWRGAAGVCVSGRGGGGVGWRWASEQLLSDPAACLYPNPLTRSLQSYSKMY
jgi:hypothetical protein